IPEKMPTHWNIHGEIDGYGSKQWAAFLMPVIMIPLLGLFWVLPWLSPKHFEIETFRGTYAFIVMLIMVLFAYIHVLTLLPALGYRTPVDRALLGGMMLFFMLLGNVLGKVQRNFFVGVRTPWTLASERVWTETHRLAAKIFVATGALGLACIALRLSIFVPLALILLAVIVTVGFSLVRYKQLERRGQL
ncbi:MAG TPA: SdpI family protein, partial [Planctomycetaceae bacterium]|nr:SdpI family protein [Planctomycetaceae bacterium]